MASPIFENHPFFKGFKKEYIDLISSYSKIDSFKPGEYIFKEGEAAEKFYVICKGKINVEIQMPDSHPFSLQSLGEGDVLGWSWFIPPNQWRFSARVIEKAELIVIDGNPLKKICETNHDLGYEIYKRLVGVFVQRLEATRDQLVEVYGQM